MIYTIRRGDTLSEIAKKYRIKDYKKDIWDHKINQIIKKYWPKGLDTTYRQLPVGQSLFLPINNVIGDSVKKEEGDVNKYVIRTPLVGDLHFKINYFKSYEAYGWPLVDMGDLTKQQTENNYFGQKSGANYKTVFEFTQDENNDAIPMMYIDPVANTFKQTHEPRKDLDVPSGDYGDTVEVPAVGKWGEIMGNINDVEEMKNGYVYIFSGPSDDELKLLSAYHVFNGIYQPVKLSADDDSHNQSTGDPALKYMVIKDFFPKEDRLNPENYYHTYVYTSNIPLTWKTLCEGDRALKNTISSLGFEITQASWLLSGLGAFTSISNYQKEFLKNRKKQKPIDYTLYYHKLQRIGGKTGYTVTVPNIENEALRRNEYFQEILLEYIRWRDDEDRTDRTFLYGIVQYLIKEGKISNSQIDMEKLEEFKNEQNAIYHTIYLPYHYSAIELVSFLKDPRFFQVILNYSHRFEESETLPHNYQDLLMMFLNKTHENLELSPVGQKYLHEVWSNINSYYHQLLDNDSFFLLQGLREKPDLKGLTALRKTNDLVGEFVGKFFLAMLKGIASEKKIGLIKKIGYFINYPAIEPEIILEGLKNEQQSKKIRKQMRKLEKQIKAHKIQLFDTYSEKGTARLKKMSSWIAPALEIVNCTIVTKTAFEDGELNADEAIKLIGCYCDLISAVAESPLSNIANSLVSKKVASIGKRFIPVFGIVSCLIDAYEAQVDMEKAMRDGEYMLALGNGAIVTGSMLLATSITVSMFSGSTLSALGLSAAIIGPFGLAGIAIIAIGALILYFNDSDIETWAESSIFGTENIVYASDSDGKEAISRQIKEIIEMLMKFDLHNVRRYDTFLGSKGYKTRLAVVIKINRLITYDSVVIIKDLIAKGSSDTYSGFMNIDLSSDRREEFKERIHQIELPISDFLINGVGIYGGDYKFDRFKKKYDFGWYRVDLYVNMKEDGSREIDYLHVFFEFKKDVDEAYGNISLEIKNSEVQKNIPEGNKYRFNYSTAFSSTGKKVIQDTSLSDAHTVVL